MESFEEILKIGREKRINKDQLFVFSIDNESTRAVDDAVSIEEITVPGYKGKLWEVGIHISDVATLVKSGTALDKEACIRAESQYVGKEFFRPMIPHELSAELCSLMEK